MNNLYSKLPQINRQIFYYHLRLIYTYYCHLQDKQNPIILKQKNLIKFLKDSTISELNKKSQENHGFYNHTHSHQIKQKEQNRNIELLLKSCNRQINFQQFNNNLADILFNLRQQKAWKIVVMQAFSNKNLFNFVKQDKKLANIFTILYEEIQMNTNFGNILQICRIKSFYDQKTFIYIKSIQQPLFTIYKHYFGNIFKQKDIFKSKQQNERNIEQKLFPLFKKILFDFQLTPTYLTLTQLFVALIQLKFMKGKSVYQKILQDSQIIYKQKYKQWKEMTFLEFVKILIILGQICEYKRQRQNQFSDNLENTQIFRNLIEKISISKGYQLIVKTYQINKPLLIEYSPPLPHSHIQNQNTNQPSRKNQKVINKNLKINQITNFQPKSFGKNKCLDILTSVSNLFQLIFNCYSSQIEIQSQNLHIIKARKLSFDKFNKFCSQFKLIPDLISKKQSSEIYFKIFAQRIFVYETQQKQSYPIEQAKYQSIEQKQEQNIENSKNNNIFNYLQKSQFGLVYQQFLHFFIYSSQLPKICQKFSAPERLIYWIQYIYHNKQKLDFLIKNKLKQSRSKQLNQYESINIDSIIKKPNQNNKDKKNIKVFNFYAEYQSMFRKLCTSLK